MGVVATMKHTEPEGTKPKPPQGFVPVAAIQGEQENTRQARAEAARYRARLEALGVDPDEPVQSPPTLEERTLILETLLRAHGILGGNGDGRTAGT